MSGRDAQLCGEFWGLVGVERQQRHEVRPAVSVDDGLGDPPGLLERVLDVRRRDVLAARGDDEVLLAAGDRDEAVGIDLTEVTGGEPAAGQRLAGGLLVLEVAGEHDRAPRMQLAVLRGAHLEVGERSADAAELPLGLRVERAGAAQLRHSPDLQQHDAARVEELEHVPRDRCGGGDRQLEPAAEQVAHLRVHEPVGDAVLEGEHASRGDACSIELARSTPDVERPVEEGALEPAAGRRCRSWRRCGSFPTRAAPRRSTSAAPP